ncbi:Fas apoptotic inhibitory molecule 2, partial [Zootermopsis nevadensis]
MNGNNRKGDCESQKGYPVQPGPSADTNQSYPPPYTDTPGSVVPPPNAPPSGSGQPCGTTPNQQAKPGGEDPPGDSAENFEFSDKTIRLGFIRKVYGILMVQLLITVAFISWFLYHDATKQYVLSHPGILFGAFGVTI